MNVLTNLTKIADIAMSASFVSRLHNAVEMTEKPILSLYKQTNPNSTKYFLFDMDITENVKRFAQYHVYETTKGNIAKFLNSKANTHLLPKEGQIVQTIHYFDNEVLNVQTYSKDSNGIILCAAMEESLFEECTTENLVLLTEFAKK